MRHVFIINSDGKAVKRSLASVMVQPRHTMLDFRGIARSLFPVEQMPQGGRLIYDRDPEVVETLIVETNDPSNNKG